MKTAMKSLLAAGLVAGSLGLAADAAKAMPLGLEPALGVESDTALRPDNVRWVCGPFGCRWAPNYYGPRPFYGPRPYWGPRRHWRRW